MNILEFLKAHGLNCRTKEEEDFMLQALDKIYLEMTPESAVRMILDYIENADDIYNEMHTEEKVLADSEEK